MTVTIKVQRLPHGRDLPLPGYQTAEAAGMDLLAAVPENEPHVLNPGERTLIPTGLSMALPKGYEAQVRPRSGLAAKHGVTLLNTPGTIDSDYRGELKVILINHGSVPFEISRGTRIAQMVIAPVLQATLEDVDILEGTERGTGGFGSTGTS